MNNIWQPEKRNYFFLMLVFIFSFFFALLVSLDTRVTPDSLRYLMVKDSLYNGVGLKLPLNWFESIYTFDTDGMVPFTVQPPGYPIHLSAIYFIFNDDQLTVTTLNTIGFLLTIFTSSLVVKNIANTNSAILTAIILSLSAPLIILADHAWSDILFIGYCYLSLYFITISKEKHTFFFLACIVASIAISIRFAGIALIPVLISTLIFQSIHQKKLNNKLLYIISLALPTLTTATLLLRNLNISGTIRGFEQPNQDRGFIDVFLGIWDALFFKSFGLGNYNFKIISSMGIISFIFVLCMMLFMNQKVREATQDSVKKGLGIYILFLISYSSLMTLTMIHGQPAFESRFFTPLLPSITIVILVAITIYRNTLSKTTSKLLIAPVYIYLLFIVLWPLQFIDKHFRNDVFINDIEGCLFDTLKDINPTPVILTNAAFNTAYFSGAPSVRLPYRGHNSRFLIPSDMDTLIIERMKANNAEYMYIFTNSRFENPSLYYGDYVTNLATKKVKNDKLSVFFECPQGVAFQLLH